MATGRRITAVVSGFFAAIALVLVSTAGVANADDTHWTIETAAAATELETAPATVNEDPDDTHW